MLGMDSQDRKFRFAHEVSEEYVKQYCDNADLDDGITYGAFIDTKLVGVVEGKMLKDNEIELSILVDKNFRNKGIGFSLIQRLLIWTKAKRIKKIYSLCLTSNSWMMRVSKKINMKIHSSYGESEGVLQVEPIFFPITLNQLEEMKNNYKMMIDYNLYLLNAFKINK